MAITVGPRSGGRSLIPLAYLAGVGKAQREDQARRDKYEFNAYQSGLDRLARERQAVFGAQVQGRRDVALGKQRQEAAGLKREQQLLDRGADQAAAADEWNRQFAAQNEQEERERLQQADRDLSEKPWDVGQRRELDSDRVALDRMQTNGQWSEDEIVQAQRDFATKWSRRNPRGDQIPEEMSPEWFMQLGIPGAQYDPETGRMFVTVNGEEKDFWLKTTANGREPVFYDETEQQDPFGDNPQEVRAKERDRQDKERDAFQKAEADYASDRRDWEQDIRDATFRLMREAKEEDRRVQKDANTLDDDPIKIKPLKDFDTEELRRQAEDEVGPPPRRPRPLAPSPQLLPGPQPGENALHPDDPTQAELAEGRPPIIPAAETNRLNPEEQAMFDELQQDAANGNIANDAEESQRQALARKKAGRGEFNSEATPIILSSPNQLFLVEPGDWFILDGQLFQRPEE